MSTGWPARRSRRASSLKGLASDRMVIDTVVRKYAETTCPFTVKA